MKILPVFLMLMLPISSVHAETYVIIVAGATKHLVILSDAGTARLVSPFTPQVVRVGDVPPDPDDPDPDDPPPDETVAVQVARWANDIADTQRANTARGLSVIYRQTKALVDQGAVQNKDQLVRATDVLYRAALGNASVNKLNLWAPWKTKVDALVDTAADLNETATLWGQIADGLDAVAGG